MANPEKATEPKHPIPAPTNENAAPNLSLSADTLRKMIASGKSVPSKASAK
jgi:hypothetical protein